MHQHCCLYFIFIRIIKLKHKKSTIPYLQRSWFSISHWKNINLWEASRSCQALFSVTQICCSNEFVYCNQSEKDIRRQIQKLVPEIIVHHCSLNCVDNFFLIQIYNTKIDFLWGFIFIFLKLTICLPFVRTYQFENSFKVLYIIDLICEVVLNSGLDSARGKISYRPC